MESVNAEKSLPFRIFALLSKMFILRGIITKIFELGSQPFQMLEKFIRFPWLNKGGSSITEHSKEIESVNAEKSLPFRIFALLSFLPQKMFILREKALLSNDKLKKENDKFRNELDNLQEKMKELQKENEWRRARNKKDDITLDAGTAHPNLCIAGDKKSLKYEAQPQKVPPHPERFDSTVCVLGSEGFSSGKHYWEVDVGSSTYWELGVARKSIERKGKLSLSPKQGFWALSLNGGDYWAKTDPWTRIMVQKKPKKIGVYLGYQDRQVTFFSVTDMSVLFTFNDCSFSGEVYPFFKNSHKGTTMRISSIKEEE